jgi:hypothetical protein
MIRSLKSKARQLRRDAIDSLAPLALALRRRASELELHAFLLEQQLAGQAYAA